MSVTDPIRMWPLFRSLLFPVLLCLLLQTGHALGQTIESEGEWSDEIIPSDSIVRVLVKNQHSGLLHDDELISQSTVVTISEFDGVVLDARGYVVSFVGSRWPEIEEPDAQFALELVNGKRISAELVGVDERISLAVLKSPALRNRGVTLNSSLNHKMVELVSRSEGKWGKSGLHVIRSDEQGPTAEVELQAKICDSGPSEFVREGSLAFDQSGRFLGIVTKIKEVGLTKSFAGYEVLPVPILMAGFKEVFEKKGNVRAGWLGVVLDSETREVRLQKVLEGTPAAEAGLRPGDIVRALNGNRMGSQLEFAKTIRWNGPGKVLDLTVERNGVATKLYPKLGEPPQERRPQLAWAVEIPRIWKEEEVTPQKNLKIYPVVMPSLLNLGLSVTTMTEQLAAVFKSPDFGLLVKAVEAGSPAEKVGFEAGDILLSVNGHIMRAESDLKKALQSTEEGVFRVRFFRKGKEEVKKVLLQ